MNTVQTKKADTLLLVGNPNVGKSAIFGDLTGRYMTVSNYPGTTVEVSRGGAALGNRKWEIVDTPGINTFVPQSEDEQVTRDMLLKGDYEVVVQVGDMKNLRRSLLITLQLAEMEVPFLVNLNMEDEARTAGIEVDKKALSQSLGIPVTSTIATQKRGLSALVDSIQRATPSTWRCNYPANIERFADEIVRILPDNLPISARPIALMLLAGDETLRSWLLEHLDEEKRAEIESIQRRLSREYPNGTRFVINQARMRAVDRLMASVFSISGSSAPPAWLHKTGNWATHPVWGVPVLAAVICFAYLLVAVFGAGILVDWMEQGLFQGFLNPRITGVVDALVPIPILRDLLVGEYGLFTMALTYAFAIVLPIVGTFFIFFGLLEDSGYMPRLAVMANRIYKRMGISGKAVLPMTLGLGCVTMATMTTRIMETRKERTIVTLLLALGIPCSAQLGVILGMLGGLGLFAVLIWTGTIALTLFLTGWVASRILAGEDSDFILELPPIRIPQIRNIMIKTVARIEWYLKEAVPLFILGTFILFLFDALGLLEVIERGASPVIQGALNLPAEATQAFLIGFLRRDYGAAGLFDLYQRGSLDPVQTLISLVVITLFMPCIANFLMIIKEQGIKNALLISAFVLPFALAVGTLLNAILRLAGWGISL
jgi:ferrous iron transport protein B